MARDHLRLCDLTERILSPVARMAERLDVESEIPVFHGALTIAEAYGAADAEAHARVVERWAGGTWEAYVARHPWARRWVAEVLVGQ